MWFSNLNKLLLASKSWPDSSLARKPQNVMQHHHFDTLSDGRILSPPPYPLPAPA